MNASFSQLDKLPACWRKFIAPPPPPPSFGWKRRSAGTEDVRSCSPRHESALKTLDDTPRAKKAKALLRERERERERSKKQVCPFCFTFTGTQFPFFTRLDKVVVEA